MTDFAPVDHPSSSEGSRGGMSPDDRLRLPSLRHVLTTRRPTEVLICFDRRRSSTKTCLTRSNRVVFSFRRRNQPCSENRRYKTVERVHKHRSNLQALQTPQRLPDFVRNSPAAPRVNHVTDLEAVELARCADGIRSHVVEGEPVPDAERIRQLGHRAHTIHGITSWPPDAAGCQGLRGTHVE